ncbi:MAG: transposase family protein [Planctomycetes bacterium]|nr:transposase family protein [Planctomycetota bacterium]
MLKRLLIILTYLVDYWAGWIFYYFSQLIGKTFRLIESAKTVFFTPSPYLSELHYLKQEVRRLKYANTLMRQELNKAKAKRLCLCKKLQIIYFKLRFNISLSKIKEYLPISKTSVINYLRQLQKGISNLASRRRISYISPYRTPLCITALIWEMHGDNPHWGRWKIAFAIWKLGVYVSPSTVRNILNSPKPDYRRPESQEEKIKMREIIGKYPNHIWSIDFTTVYIWFKPLYILAVIDHFSRKAMVIATTFHPTAEWTIDKIKETALKYGTPKHLITDKGTQFTAGDFIRYLRGVGITHRYACIRRANGNSKVERFFRSLKYELLNLYLFFSKAKVDRLLKDYLAYYNEYRTHEALDGRVPNDRYSHKPRDKPDKNDKAIKGTVERIQFADGLLNAYRIKQVA